VGKRRRHLLHANAVVIPVREERRGVRFDVVDWVHKVIAVTAEQLSIRSLAFRRRLDKSLDDLDREIWNSRLPDAADSSDEPLDVDALASTEELRLIIGLHLDGWTWPDIKTRLRNR
jgi:hypothetical protein